MAENTSCRLSEELFFLAKELGSRPLTKVYLHIRLVGLVGLVRK
jgi:hypothetical protein